MSAVYDCRSEHEALCALLEEAGAEVIAVDGDPDNPDAIYVYDPVLVRRRTCRSAR